MTSRLATVTSILLLLGAAGKPAFAHRLDEYLQATLITIAPDSISASMRLIPGVSVSSSVIAAIDVNRDGILSPEEQKHYAQAVLDHLTVTVDGTILQPSLSSATFPDIQQMKDGLGEIHLVYTIPILRPAPHHTVILENRHESPPPAFLVNATIPHDPGIQIIAQRRNLQQSHYELDYDQPFNPAHQTPGVAIAIAAAISAGVASAVARSASSP